MPERRGATTSTSASRVRAASPSTRRTARDFVRPAQTGRREDENLQAREYDRPVRLRLPSTFPVVAGWVLVTAVAVMLLIRLPGAFHSFGTATASASGRDELGGALATADEVGLNDTFVRDAFADIPQHARFVVALPADEAATETKDDVDPTTFSAAELFFEDFLMPRRVVAGTARGVYVVCLYCDSGWNRRTRWLSPVEGGGRVGVVDR